MQCYKNSGWLYHVGDAIFKNVLLVNAGDLHSVCDVYASSIVCIDDISSLMRGEILSEIPEEGFDCVIVNATGSVSCNSNDEAKYLSLIKDDGVVAIMRGIDSDVANLTKRSYPWLFVKGLLKHIVKKLKDIRFGDVVTNIYIRSVGGRVNQILYENGYKPAKNPFLLKEKIRKIFLSRYTYPLFSSNVLTVLRKTDCIHKTVVDNVIEKVSSETGVKFHKITRCLVIPFKVLVSVDTVENIKYIFLLLRGAEGNIRANKEMDMINYINTTYPELSAYLSECLVHGFYKKLEYIVYRELSGVNIDADFDRFNMAERSAFKKLILIGDVTNNNILFDGDNYNEIFGAWLERLKYSKDNNQNFDIYIDDLSTIISSKLNGINCPMMLFHGDYKIENIIFDENDYSVVGIIDWDLSEKIQFPALDLLYFILYSRRIHNKTSFIEECDSVFLGESFTEHEMEMIKEYCVHFSVSSVLFNIAKILFLWHHFSFRECGDFEEEWLIRVLDSVKADL